MAKRNPLDQMDDWFDRVYDKTLGIVDPSMADARDVPHVQHKWWIVTNSTDTHMVITDPDRCIVIAPLVWNRFIGMNLDVLLSRVHAHASPIPGPVHKQ